MTLSELMKLFEEDATHRRRIGNVRYLLERAETVIAGVRIKTVADIETTRVQTAIGKITVR